MHRGKQEHGQVTAECSAVSTYGAPTAHKALGGFWRHSSEQAARPLPPGSSRKMDINQ